MLPVEDINEFTSVASTANKKRKREAKGEIKADPRTMQRILELCKQLTNENVEPGSCIRKELIAMLKTVSAVSRNPKWGDVIKPNTLLHHVKVAEKLVSLLSGSYDVEGNAEGHTYGRLCLAVAAAGAVIAVLTKKASEGKPTEPNQLVSANARLLCSSISLLSHGMRQIEMTGKQKALLREKGFLSALKKFVMAVGGAAFAWNLVEPIKHFLNSLFTSTLVLSDGKSHKRKTLKKLSELLASCSTSLVDAFFVTACGEACLSAIIQQETDKTTFSADLIESFVDAIDMALPASPVLHIGDTKVFESYYFSLATAAGCVLQLRCALHLPKSPTVIRLPHDFKAVAETMIHYMSGKKDQGSVGVLEQALAYVHGVCVITACMKPSASSYHFGSVLCLLMLLLHWMGHDMDPVNKVIPMTAMFPGASGEDTPGSTAELRGKALLALHTLISGATDQQVREVIRFAQNLLGGRCNGFSGLAAAELVLMTLEAYGTCREYEHDRRLHVGGISIKSTSLRTFNHALAQRGDRMACILIRALSVAPLESAPQACPPRRAYHRGDTSNVTAGVYYARLCTEFLQGYKGKEKSDITDTGQRKTFEFEWAHAGVDPSSEWVGPFVPTALRALESIVGRPKVFNDIPARTFIRLIQCLSIRLPVGECNSESASAMVATCRVLSSLLRHRGEAITPSMSQVAHILGALLRWILVDAFRNGPTSKVLNYCSEVLGAVVVEFGSRGQSTAALCPHVLREYILAQTRTNFQAIETTAIRHGAYALYGGSGPGGIEYLYATLGSGGHASAALQALADIKAGYEAEYKYTGKV
jgi:hypothetical protein